MKANHQELYSELRTTQKELMESLHYDRCSNLTRPIIEEELKDIEDTLAKMQIGSFGRCEISGEILPEDYLFMVPTIKSLDDVNEMSKFYCKPIYT